MPKFDRLERVEMRKGNKIETMEATVVLFGPSSVPADLDGLAAACKDFGTKSENLLAGAKYKPIQIWMAEAHGEGLRYRLLFSLFGRQAKVGRAVDETMWLTSITKSLPSKPSRKSPLFVTMYSTDTPTISPPWTFEVKLFDHHSENFGLDFVYDSEFCPYRIAELAAFSATAHPMLHLLKQPSVGKPRPIHPELARCKAFMQGMALERNSSSAEVSFDNGTIWMLELSDGVAKMHEAGQRTVLQTFECSPIDSRPLFLTDPANPIVSQLFRLIRLLDASEGQLDPAMLGNTELILNSFVERALKDDIQLFPVYGNNSTARALGIKRVIRCLRQLNIKHRALGVSVSNALRRYDAEDKAPSRGKKFKYQSETSVDLATSDFRMRPYLEFVTGAQVPAAPLSKEDSLFSVYWRMRELFQETSVPSCKRFWE